MKNRRFAIISAAVTVSVLFLLSILITKLEIEESYSVIQENGLVGTPMPFGIIVIAGFLWIAAFVLFIVADIFHAAFARGNEAFLSCFIVDFCVYLLIMLLFWPLLLAALWIGAMLVQL